MNELEVFQVPPKDINYTAACAVSDVSSIVSRNGTEEGDRGYRIDLCCLGDARKSASLLELELSS